MGFTFLMILMQLPQYAISYNTVENKVEINISWEEIGRIINDSYKNLLKGSLGVDSRGNSIWGEIKPYFKNTIILILSTLIISLVLGILLGAYDSRKTIIAKDTGRVLWKTILRSLPEPLIILLLYIIILKIFKFKSIMPRKSVRISFKDYIVPIMALSIPQIMKTSKMISKSIINTHNSEYLISVKMKGASNLRILKNHLIINVFLDNMKELFSFMVLIFANLVVVEYLFYFPGLTNKLIESYIDKDMNTVFGITILIGLIFILLNIMFKIIKNLIDPIEDKPAVMEMRW